MTGKKFDILMNALWEIEDTLTSIDEKLDKMTRGKK